jgi:hypothetical protein
MQSSPISFCVKPLDPKVKNDLSTPLLNILGNQWTIGDACEGVQIFGGTGSGKTSGSGQSLAKCYLYNGFGGLVLTVKAGDREMWVDYCNKQGRSEDLIIINESNHYKFNFLHYLVSEGYKTVNISKIFLSALQKHNEGDYWQTAMEQLIKNTINLLMTATGTLSLQDMYEIVINAPQDSVQAEAMFAKINLRYKEYLESVLKVQTSTSISSSVKIPNYQEIFHDSSTCFENTILLAKIKIHELAKLDQIVLDEYKAIVTQLEESKKLHELKEFKERGKPTLLYKNKILEFEKMTLNYWQKEFPDMDSKPRSSIVSMFTGMADCLLREEMRDILSCDTSDPDYKPDYLPQDTFNGKIIIFDLSIKEFEETGKMAQLIFKSIFQKAVEKHRENVIDKSMMKPIFLWIDEAQFFLTKNDVLFQTTARSSKVCSVYLTQNYSNYLAFVGSNREKSTVDSFLAVLQTKFFHCQSDPYTNEDYVIKLIGKSYQNKQSSTSIIGSSNTEHTTSNTSKELEYKILPWQLDQLAKGGEFNGNKVQAYVYQSGRTWHETKDNYGLIEFNQVLESEGANGNENSNKSSGQNI